MMRELETSRLRGCSEEVEVWIELADVITRFDAERDDVSQ